MAIFIFCQVFATLALPDYMAKIINQGIIGQNTRVIFHNGLIMILITIGGGLATVAVGYLASKVGTGFARNLRSAVFNKNRKFLIHLIFQTQYDKKEQKSTFESYSKMAS